MGKDPERDKRLAEALRANLKRRKEQQRAAGATGGEPAHGDECSGKLGRLPEENKI